MILLKMFNVRRTIIVLIFVLVCRGGGQGKLMKSEFLAMVDFLDQVNFFDFFCV